MLALVLVFLLKFDDLPALPAAYTCMTIVIVAGGSGKTVGACVQGVFLGLGGVVLGAGFFAILANLGYFPVAQAIVFIVIVYCEFYILTSSSHPGNRATAAHSRSTLYIATYSLFPSLRLSVQDVPPLNANNVIYFIFESSVKYATRQLTDCLLVMSHQDHRHPLVWFLTPRHPYGLQRHLYINSVGRRLLTQIS